MELARLRRMTVIFVLFGLFLPVAPHALGFPHDRLYCFDIRLGDSQCACAGLVCLILASVLRACVWTTLTPGDRRRTWPTIAVLALVFVMLPMVPLPCWTWNALR